jgi:hypothetical protein
MASFSLLLFHYATHLIREVIQNPKDPHPYGRFELTLGLNEKVLNKFAKLAYLFDGDDDEQLCGS